MALRIAITIDVPDLDAGLRFYGAAFGFEEVARPAPMYAMLQSGEARIALMEKAEGSSPAKGSDDRRRYARHWTPVHLDLHVDDFKAALARAVDAGATMEERFDMEGRPPVAFCSDPFGHGFCLIGPRP